MREWAVALLAGAGLLGCASGPNYQAPAANVDAALLFAGAGVAAGEPVAVFWRQFNDPLLNQLVEQALKANADVKVAQARLQEARANAGAAQAELLPSVGTAASVARTNPVGPGGADNNFAANATFNWELDFFGRNRRASESAAALVQAGEAGVHAAQVLVSAEVVRNHLERRGLQLRLQVAEESLRNQRENLRLVEVREQLGRGTPLDVARARALVDSTEALLPALQGGIERAALRLGTLTAQRPSAITQQLAAPQLLPLLAPTDLGLLAAGTPEALLQRRPDVRTAERQLAAATANIGVARADLFPRISLTGLLGFSSNRLADLLQGDSRTSSLGAGLTWNALDFGRLRARIDASEARTQQALAVYEQTVQTAIEETEGALSLNRRTVEQTDRLASAARNAEEAARLARIRFEGGATDFLSVLDAERGVLQARDALVQAQVGSVTSLVAVYRALGGGWMPAP